MILKRKEHFNRPKVTTDRVKKTLYFDECALSVFLAIFLKLFSFSAGYRPACIK